MHEVVLSTEGQKTVINNLEEIGRELKRDPAHILKFLGLTFGCNTKISEQNGIYKYSLPGTYEDSKIQGVVFDFIDLFVLCNACENPETFFVLKDAGLYRHCSSCGAYCKQVEHKMITVFLKDIENDKYQDKNYEKEVAKTETKHSEEVYSNLNHKKLTPEIIHPLETFLLNLENTLEKEERPEQIKKFLKELIKLDVKIDDIEDYFNKPNKDGKRNALIKNRVKKFLDEYEE